MSTVIAWCFGILCLDLLVVCVYAWFAIGELQAECESLSKARKPFCMPITDVSYTEITTPSGNRVAGL